MDSSGNLPSTCSHCKPRIWESVLKLLVDWKLQIVQQKVAYIDISYYITLYHLVYIIPIKSYLKNLYPIISVLDHMIYVYIKIHIYIYTYMYSIYHTIYMSRNRCAFLKSRLSQVILPWEYLGTKPENQLSGEAVQQSQWSYVCCSLRCKMRGWKAA